METDLIKDRYRSFKQLIRLDFSKDTIYLLYYDDRSCLLKIDYEKEHLLLDTSTGKLLRGKHLSRLVDKVTAMIRLMGGKLESETISSFLRIPEVLFLFGEIVIDDPKLKERLFHRLQNHFKYQIDLNQLHPLYLDQYFENVGYIFNYMLTNLGSPEQTENYFNKLRLMLTQILENTEYNKIEEYFPLIQSMVELARDGKNDFVVIRGKNCYCIIRSRLSDIEGLDGFYHDEPLSKNIETRADVDVIEITNAYLNDLLKVYVKKE